MRKLKNSELNRIDINTFKKTEKIPVVVILDNIRSCNNIGSVFRTSDALLIESIYLCGYTATPPHKDIHKTALDAEKSVNWQYVKETTDAVLELQSKGYNVYAIEQVDKSILLPDFSPSPDEKIALVFGNEIKGVQQKVIDICNGAIEIPQYGTKHSFNISVSAGIVLWDIFNKCYYQNNLP
ncbi:MAG: RNA methyltransferase [Prolixibacteraceae bacterium]|nr:RNA methyltransferase [Prolixibacteraceae bacterium]MBN2649921.1 RNA methyltransferase [Prolixibacteraceae bacterium]